MDVSADKEVIPLNFENYLDPDPKSGPE